MRESRRRRDNRGNEGTGQQPVGRTRDATAAQAGGSGDSQQRAKWVRLMMLLRLRERFSCWAGFRVVLTRKGIDAMYKAYNKRRKKRTDISDDETEASADEGRADPGDWGAGADGIGCRGNVGKRHEEGGDLDRLWRTRRHGRRRAEDGEAEQTRRARRGRSVSYTHLTLPTIYSV